MDIEEEIKLYDSVFDSIAENYYANCENKYRGYRDMFINIFKQGEIAVFKLMSERLREQSQYQEEVVRIFEKVLRTYFLDGDNSESIIESVTDVLRGKLKNLPNKK